MCEAHRLRFSTRLSHTANACNSSRGWELHFCALHSDRENWFRNNIDFIHRCALFALTDCDLTCSLRWRDPLETFRRMGNVCIGRGEWKWLAIIRCSVEFATIGIVYLMDWPGFCAANFSSGLKWKKYLMYSKLWSIDWKKLLNYLFH
jgi:hypothetical protein